MGDNQVKKIVYLAGDSPFSLIMYNALKRDFNFSAILVEQGPSRRKFLKRRIKKLGFPMVFGQILFQMLIIPFLKIESRRRISDIILKKNYEVKAYEDHKLFEVPSVNSRECLRILDKIQPDIIVVQGTRIISKKLLDSSEAIFLNTHTGITPLHRGVHGAYWSKVYGDGHCGVTVHLIDPGIDTGGIIYQENIKTEADDNFISYPYLQLSKGIELMKLAIQDAAKNKIRIINNDLDSKLRTHPTFWFYLKTRITKGVK